MSILIGKIMFLGPFLMRQSVTQDLVPGIRTIANRRPRDRTQVMARDISTGATSETETMWVRWGCLEREIKGIELELKNDSINPLWKAKTRFQTFEKAWRRLEIKFLNTIFHLILVFSKGRDGDTIFGRATAVCLSGLGSNPMLNFDYFPVQTVILFLLGVRFPVV